MHAYSHHFGSYAKKTGHLSWDQDQAYTRLLRLYYRAECPLPADVAEVARLVNAGSKSQRAAVASVLGEFFVLRVDGWHQERCDEEIEKANYRSKRDPGVPAPSEAELEGQRAALRMERFELRQALGFLGVPVRWDAPVTLLRQQLAEAEAAEDLTSRAQARTRVHAGAGERGRGHAGERASACADAIKGSTTTLEHENLNALFAVTPACAAGASAPACDTCVDAHTREAAPASPTPTSFEVEPDAPAPPAGLTAGEVTKAMRAKGMASVNPGDPRLLKLIEQGATLAEFEGVAEDAVRRKKGFAYSLVALESLREQAAAIKLAPLPPGAPPAPPPNPIAWGETRLGVLAMADQLEMVTRWNEVDAYNGQCLPWSKYRALVVSKWNEAGRPAPVVR